MDNSPFSQNTLQAIKLEPESKLTVAMSVSVVIAITAVFFAVIAVI